MTVTFFVEGAYICRYVHNLVLGAFKGQRPSGLEGRHLDGNVLNNRADNLEWATHVENEADKIQHGTDSRGERNGMAKLSNAEAQIIRESGESGVSLARKYGVSQTAVSRIRKGVRYARG